MNKAYICAVKILGFQWVTLSKETADKWVEESPDTHYYNEVPLR